MRLLPDWHLARIPAMYSVSQKNPIREFSDIFFPNGWEFSVQILHTYYTFLSMLDYRFLFSYLQLCQSYAILSATTQRAFGRWWTFWAYDVNWVVTLNIV